MAFTETLINLLSDRNHWARRSTVLLYTAVILTIFAGLSCKTNMGGEMKITGHLSGLPDGHIYLLDQNRKIVDSSATADGNFELAVRRSMYQEPPYLTLEHRDKNGHKRMFNFVTNKLKNGGGLHSQFFMLEDTSDIQITGALKDFTPKDFVLPDSVKLVYPEDPIHAGKQTAVLYNISFEFDRMTDSTFQRIKSWVKKYPYSYYLLYELNKNQGSLSNPQVQSLLNDFNPELRKSATAQEIAKRITAREEQKLGIKTKLENTSGSLQPALDPSKELNVLILWASWCGPCRMEIKELKPLYEQFSKNSHVRFVSVSIDQNKKDWQKAVDEEKMPWEQMWLPSNLAAYSREIFGFNGTIPATLFVDNKGNVFKRFSGYAPGVKDEYTAEIKRYLDSSGLAMK
ncbi:TlpA disulfide reductase family protein [Deminuibacter soli]|nr:TlpA disulfide reductase family protein [Deminuibacter soli]